MRFTSFTTEKLIPRIAALKDDLFTCESQTCFERAKIVTESYKNSEGSPEIIRRARAIRDVFDHLPIFIRPGELIVGQRASVLGGRSLYPEYNLHGLTQDTAPEGIYEYWQERSIGSEFRRRVPDNVAAAEKEMAAGYTTGRDSGYGHVIADYAKVLNRGILSIIKDIESDMADSRDDSEGRLFQDSVILVLQGLLNWADRYADLAEERASKEFRSGRRQELLEIARICRKVPAGPAESFHEALQSFWFIHMALHLEQYGWSISTGRFDQYMFPFLCHSLEENSEEQQWELLLSLWVKFMENVGLGNVRDTVFQNMTLGGVDVKGRDQSNGLSHWCLDATAVTGFNQPAISVRWHRNIDPDFWLHSHKTIALGYGLPALFNDTVIIEGLVSHGIDPEDAAGYGLIGCVESGIPGKQQGVTAGGHLNIAKALELALNRGKSLITGIQIGPVTPPPEEMTCFEDLWEAYVEQVHCLADINITSSRLAGEIQKEKGFCPLLSSLLDDCLPLKRDMVKGAVKYHLPGIAIFGPSNVYDGMNAIRKWVFEEKQFSLSELTEALGKDFEGFEKLQSLLRLHSPRFGNDLLETDNLAVRINSLHSDYFRRHADTLGGRYTCGVWPVNNHVSAGKWTAATPDGRNSGSPLVDGVGACQGADLSGPTALLNSVSRLDGPNNWSAGNTCNIKFSPREVGSDKGLCSIADMVTVFFIKGGMQLQINVVDGETLKAAQEKPENYSNLLVRVAGYSGYFTQLERDIQNEIISRISQSVI
jgi:pyruvate formate-lyase/glycerol dehydratase family glycyl radical enzyme